VGIIPEGSCESLPPRLVPIDVMEDAAGPGHLPLLECGRMLKAERTQGADGLDNVAGRGDG